MPSTYRITEPHPSIPTTHASTLYYGRGGAGNITHIASATSGPDATGPASRIKLSPPSNVRYLSGRGGAGNVHREKERAMFSFDEELAQQERLREHAAPVYHIGRGGAGNLIDEAPRQRTGSTGSNSSNGSEGVRRSVDSAWHKMKRQFSHGA
jgi:hypothetical protein